MEFIISIKFFYFFRFKVGVRILLEFLIVEIYFMDIVVHYILEYVFFFAINTGIHDIIMVNNALLTHHLWLKVHIINIIFSNLLPDTLNIIFWSIRRIAIFTREFYLNRVRLRLDIFGLFNKSWFFVFWFWKSIVHSNCLECCICSLGYADTLRYVATAKGVVLRWHHCRHIVPRVNRVSSHRHSRWT